MMLRPSHLEEVVEGIRGSAPSSLVFRGGGTKRDWGRLVPKVGCLLTSRNLSGVLEHDAGDMTATVLAGTPLVTLQEVLAPHQQWLAVDPPVGPDRSATLGGIFSAHDAGPSRVAYGSLRELVIGMTVVLSDGTVARSGGKVIKNVAGFDLCKLFCGALGTLGFVHSLTVRVHPLPERRATLELRGNKTQCAGMAAQLARSTLEPAAVDMLEGRLLVRFDGTATRVARQMELTLADAQARRLRGEELKSPGDDIAWRDVSRALSGHPGETVLRVAAPPARLLDVSEAAHRAAGESGVDAREHIHAALGLHTLRLTGAELDGHITMVKRLRAALAGFGRVVVRRRPEAIADRIDVLGPPPSAAFLMRRIRAELDPEGRCAPGRLDWGQV